MRNSALQQKHIILVIRGLFECPLQLEQYNSNSRVSRYVEYSEKSCSIGIFVKLVLLTIRHHDLSNLLQWTAAAGQELKSIHSTTSPCYKKKSTTDSPYAEQRSAAADAQQLKWTGSPFHNNKSATAPYEEMGFPVSVETLLASALSN